MTKILSELLGEGEPMFSVALRQLERATGNQGIDVKLTADIITRTHAAKKSLGLDHTDTTGRELYHALMGVAALHDTFLARRLGADDPSDVADMLNRIRIASQNVHVPRDAWVIKHSSMKRLLKALPPKIAMKSLGYRSLDSMLKREPVASIMAAARIIESPKWQQSFVSSYSKLTPLDFEMREIEILHPTTDKWQKLAAPFVKASHQNLTHLKELGAVIILPLPMEKLAGVTLAVFPRVLHYIQDIRVYSAYFKLQQVRPDFGDMIVQTIIDDPDDTYSAVGQPIHWRIIHRHFGRQSSLPEMFEPHVTASDIEWRAVEEVLFELEPALQFWHGLDFVGAPDSDGPVSLSLSDVAVCYVNNLPFAHRVVSGMRRSLRAELHQRYVAHPVLERHILHQLEDSPPDDDFASLLSIQFTD